MTSKSLPWGINRIGNMFMPKTCTSSDDGNIWVRAIAVPYSKNWRERIRAAWWVLTGRAEAVVWPKGGELEAVWFKDDP